MTDMKMDTPGHHVLLSNAQRDALGNPIHAPYTWAPVVWKVAKGRLSWWTCWSWSGVLPGRLGCEGEVLRPDRTGIDRGGAAAKACQYCQEGDAEGDPPAE